MFTASIGPYMYSIAGFDPSTWTVPSYLRRRALQGQLLGETKEVTMHVAPDPHTVRVLGRASGTVKTTCGQVSVASRGGARRALRGDLPHNCGHARLALHVPEAFDASGALCVGTDRVGGDETQAKKHTIAPQCLPLTNGARQQGGGRCRGRRSLGTQARALLARRSLIGARRGKNRCKLSDLHVIGEDATLCKLLRRER